MQWVKALIAIKEILQIIKDFLNKYKKWQDDKETKKSLDLIDKGNADGDTRKIEEAFDPNNVGEPSNIDGVQRRRGTLSGGSLENKS